MSQVGRATRVSIAPLVLCALLGCALVGCTLAGCTLAGCAPKSAGTPVPAGPREVILATTTSAQDSGLLDVLLPRFEAETGYAVKVVPGGSGQALAMGERGEADVVLAHSPAGENELLASGVVISRRPVMHNDFIIVGPAADPAGVKAASQAIAAFKAIAAAQALFVSRGDQSGTNVKELDLWQAAQIEPQGADWYQECGAGMAQALQIASEKDAYTLADRGTYLSLRGTLSLAIACEGDPVLINRYSVLEVNPARFDRVNGAGGKALADFLAGTAAREIITTFGVDKYGEPLFYPDSE